MPSIEKVKRGYRVTVRLKGFPNAHATLPSYAMAQHWATKTYNSMVANKYFGAGFAMTFAELVDQYQSQEMLIRQSSNTQTVTERNLALFLPYLKDKLIAHIKARDILDIRQQWLHENKSAGYINRIISCLSACLSYAVEREIIDANVCRKIRALPIPPKKDRILSTLEEERLRQALYAIDIDTYDTVVFALTTGARKGEIKKLRMSQVDLNEKTLTFLATKNGKDRTIPLSDFWCRFFQMKERSFRFKLSDTFWKRACSQAEVVNFRFHDLRHTFITRAIASGKSPALVGAFVGHSSQGMTAHYTHLTPDSLRGLI